MNTLSSYRPLKYSIMTAILLLVIPTVVLLFPLSNK